MNISKQLSSALGLGIAFLLAHIAIVSLSQDQVINLILIIGAMVAVQVYAFIVLRRNMNGQKIGFKNIFFLLCLTQFFSVIFLTLYSAYAPWGDAQPVHIDELITSLILFAGILPLIISLILWSGTVKKRNKGIAG
ncbi:MAG: hypothetical protein JWO44_2674 [Bacteroidetes bacterium]|nr:hypothetical protein [Bacteroidota bacterium]